MVMKHLDLTGLNVEAEASWEGVLDVARECSEGWSLAGGQAVFVQTRIRGQRPERPSTDADLVIDLRANSAAARILVEALRTVGFRETRRDDKGRMHRWVRGDAQIDVLQPRFLGERAERRLSRASLETIGAPGAQHLLSRTEQVRVSLADKSAEVRTPTALGIVVAKAAGFQEIIHDPYRVRHLADILTVAPLISARDLRAERPYTRLERQRVGNAIGSIRTGKFSDELRAWFPNDLDQRLADLAQVHDSHTDRLRANPSPRNAVTAFSQPVPKDPLWPPKFAGLKKSGDGVTRHDPGQGHSPGQGPSM